MRHDDRKFSEVLKAKNGQGGPCPVFQTAARFAELILGRGLTAPAQSFNARDGQAQERNGCSPIRDAREIARSDEVCGSRPDGNPDHLGQGEGSRRRDRRRHETEGWRSSDRGCSERLGRDQGSAPHAGGGHIGSKQGVRAARILRNPVPPATSRPEPKSRQPSHRQAKQH